MIYLAHLYNRHHKVLHNKRQKKDFLIKYFYTFSVYFVEISAGYMQLK